MRVAAHDEDGARRRNEVRVPGSAAAAEGSVSAAELSTAHHALSGSGRPLNRRSPFSIGMSAAAEVAVTGGAAKMIITVRAVLVLIGLALFLAIGLEPAVSVLSRHKCPHWAGVNRPGFRAHLNLCERPG